MNRKSLSNSLKPVHRVLKPKAAPGKITNETVAEHREEVLSSARKYIYPLSHSRQHIVRISISLLATAVVLFFAYCGFALYGTQSTSTFVYDVTRVIPFPVAKAGPDFVSYESYLFELRHYMHYYQSQQGVNFNSQSGKQQLKLFKKQALDQVISDAYVKRLAAENYVSVSSKDVNAEIALVRSQNRLGDSDQVFRSVLQQFWGWSVDDFKRELTQEIMAQKVVAKLDTGTEQEAQQALDQLNAGSDFAQVADRVSATEAAVANGSPATPANGGQYPGWIDQNNRDIAPQVSQQLFKLAPGQHSDIINTGYSLEIVKVLNQKSNQVQAAHISFNFKDIKTYTDPLEKKHSAHHYIKV